MRPREAVRTDAEPDEPCYVISVASRMVGVHPQTLRYYERQGLVSPSRSSGNIRLYCRGDLERLRRIKVLTEDMGVNLAGVEVCMRVLERMAEMEREIDLLRDELDRTRRRGRDAGESGHSGEESEVTRWR